MDDDKPVNKIMEVPAIVFTGGLDFDQEVTLQTINECLNRGQRYTAELARGNEELLHQFEPLRRILTGIADTSVIPILALINEGTDPPTAFKEVLAGIGGLMFFGGIEYAKAMGLNGVGVPLKSAKEYAPDVYPEEKPLVAATSQDLEALLANFTSGDEEEEG
jgi:hypothetical protein